MSRSRVKEEQDSFVARSKVINRNFSNNRNAKVERQIYLYFYFLHVQTEETCTRFFSFYDVLIFLLSFSYFYAQTVRMLLPLAM